MNYYIMRSAMPTAALAHVHTNVEHATLNMQLTQLIYLIYQTKPTSKVIFQT